MMLTPKLGNVAKYLKQFITLKWTSKLFGEFEEFLLELGLRQVDCI